MDRDDDHPEVVDTPESDESDRAAPLRVSVRSLDGAVVLRPDGELDHDSVAPFRQALEEALRSGSPLVLVDCTDLEFCDSTGLNLLLRARRIAAERDATVALAAPQPIVARLLEITGACEVLPVHPSVDTALGGRTAGGVEADA